MSQRPWLSPHAMCSVLVSIAAVAGCKQVPATLAVVPSARAERGTAVVSADPSALTRHLAARRVLGTGFREAAITQLRLSTKVPGGTAVNGPSIPYTPTTPATMPTTPLTMTVSAGPNRLFMLEGLDAAGRSLAAITTAATLTDGSTYALTFNGVTNIVAEAIDDALSSGGDSTFQTEVQAGDVVTTLMAYVQASVGLNSATNQFTGVDPLAYDRPYLVTLLTAAGVAGLGSTPPSALSEARWGRLIVMPSQYDGRTPYGGYGVTIDVYDPTSGQVDTAAANALGEFIFPKVPMGDWHVRIQVPDGAPTAWHKVPVKGDTYARLRAVAPPEAPTTPVAAGAAPTIAGTTNGDQSLMVWQDGTGPGAEILGQRYDQNRQPVGAPFAISNRAGLADVAPVVTYNPIQGQFVVAWSDEASMVLARGVSLTGALSPATYTEAAAAVAAPAIACNTSSGELLLARNTANGILVAKLTQAASGDLTGTPAGAFSASPQCHSPAVAYNRAANQYLIAYADGTAGAMDIHAQTLDGTATTVVQTTQVIGGGTGDQLAPSVASRAAGAALADVSSYGNEFMVVWEDHASGSPEIRGRRVTSGAGVTPYAAERIAQGTGNYRPRVDFMVDRDANSAQAGHQGGPNADHYLVSWEAFDGTNRDIHARRVASGLNQPLDNRGEMVLLKDATLDSRPAVWADPGHLDYVVVWQGGSSVRQSIIR